MNRGIIGIIAAIVVIVIIAAGSWYTVDQTERGVRLRYGAVVGTAQPGLGFKIPLIDSVEKISVKTSTFAWDKMNSAGLARQGSGPLCQIRPAGHGGQSGGQPCRESAGQDRIRPLYGGEGD